jgi:peroxiredoxin
VRLGERALTWLLGGLAAIIAVMTVGVVWVTLRPPAADSPREELHAGMVAPDFGLPDDADRTRRLSELDGKPTVLLFLCGCDRCYLMVRALQETEKGLRGEKPRHVVVTTMTPSEADTWQVRTGFHALFLFEKSSRGPVMQQFAGHPCPRVYVLDSRRSIKYISPSPKGEAKPEQVMAELAAALRLAGQGTSAPGSDGVPSPAPGHA